MKNLLIVLALLSIIAISLWAKHKGFIFSKEETPPSFLATPEELADIIDKSNNQIAQYFFDKGINRKDSEFGTEYSGTLQNNYDETFGTIYLPQKPSLTMYYVFYSKEQFQEFFDDVKKKATETLNYKDSTGAYPAYRFKNTVFAQIGFQKINNSYNAEIFSEGREKLLVEQNVILKKDSLSMPKKDSIPAIAPKYDLCLSTIRSGDYEAEEPDLADISFSGRNGDFLHFSGTIGLRGIQGEVEIYNNQLTITAGNAEGKFFMYNNCKKMVGYFTKPDTVTYIYKKL